MTVTGTCPNTRHSLGVGVHAHTEFKGRSEAYFYRHIYNSDAYTRFTCARVCTTRTQCYYRGVYLYSGAML